MKPLKCVHFSLTQRWLKKSAIFLAVTDRVQVSGIYQSPEIVLVVTAVESQSKPWALHSHDCGNTCWGKVSWVRCFQLHSNFKVILRGNWTLQMTKQIHVCGLGDTIWRCRSWSTLVQVMAWCLTAPSDYWTTADLLSTELLRTKFNDIQIKSNCKNFVSGNYI